LFLFLFLFLFWGSACAAKTESLVGYYSTTALLEKQKENKKV